MWDYGPTPNDAGDGDNGPNGLLNAPVITGASESTISGMTCAGCTVLLYRARGHTGAPGGGGQRIDGTISADSAGAWMATLPAGLRCLDVIPMTCAGSCAPWANTSELSLRAQIVLPSIIK
jgi:hypothetical protein